jgi:hypothetical protein
MLDACDLYGVYMMDEAFDQWFIPKNRFDYAKDFDKCHLPDLKSMVDKDYNHPSVIMYSIGNEVSETQQKRGVDLAREMSDYIKSIDDTRPVTCGINLFLNGLVSKGLGVYREDGGSVNEKMTANDTGKTAKLVGSAFYNRIVGHLGTIKNWISKANFADRATKEAYAHLDICGYNYGTARYEMDGRKYPERVIVVSETFIPDLYDNWKQVKAYPYLIGDFMWTAWDYLGEAGIGIWSYGRYGGFFSQYPSLTARCGAIDITGQWSPVMHYIRTSYGLEKKPHIGVRPLTHTGRRVIKSPWRNTDAIERWSWPGFEGVRSNVEVYTDAALVRLTLNGKSLGTAAPPKRHSPFFGAV